MKRGVQPSLIDENIHQKPRTLTNEDLVTMHLPRRYWESRRDVFNPAWRVREVIDKLSNRIPERLMSGRPSLVLLYGPASTGKTSAAAILAKACRAHRFTVFFLDGASILKNFPTDQTTADEEQTYRERAYTTDVLVLDALGTGYSVNNYVAAETFALLKHRQDHMKLTIVTTPCEMDALADVYGEPFRALLETSVILVPCQDRVQSIAGGVK